MSFQAPPQTNVAAPVTQGNVMPGFLPPVLPPPPIPPAFPGYQVPPPNQGQQGKVIKNLWNVKLTEYYLFRNSCYTVR